MISGKNNITLYAPQDVLKSLEAIRVPVSVVMLDPWYNKGIGGTRDDYDDWLAHSPLTTALSPPRHSSDAQAPFNDPNVLLRRIAEDRLTTQLCTDGSGGAGSAHGIENDVARLRSHENQGSMTLSGF